MKAGILPIAALVFLTLTVIPTVAGEVAPANAAIEQCVRDNAAAVEATIADLNQAVDFLVKKTCAVPVAAHNALVAKRRQDQMTATWKAMCDKKKATAASRDDKDKPSLDLCAMQDYSVGIVGVASDDEDPAYLLADVPPSAVALAARLLLDLRRAHHNSGP